MITEMEASSPVSLLLKGNASCLFLSVARSVAASGRLADVWCEASSWRRLVPVVKVERELVRDAARGEHLDTV